MAADDMQASPLHEEEPDESVISEAAAGTGDAKGNGKRRGIFGRIFRRGKGKTKAEDFLNMTEASHNETEVLDESPPPLTWRESFFGKASITTAAAEAAVVSSEAIVEGATGALPSSTILEDLDLPPIMQVPLHSKGGRPIVAAASVPLALVVCMLLLRAAWYFYQHRQKLAAAAAEEAGTETAQTSTSAPQNDRTNISNASNGHGQPQHAAVEIVKKPPMSEEAEQELKRTLEREAIAKQSLATENQALQQALDMHKSSVDRFSAELQTRNERLSVFEKEQDSVRRQLSSQIDVLKQELQERQKQEQGNLKDKESLCNDLITKIKALNKDLENHEKLWQGVAQKAEKKEVESAAKVETLQKALKEEEQQRLAAVRAKEDACADLATKLQALQAQQAKQAAQTAALDKQMGAGVFPAAEAKLRSRLREEQDYASSLTTKLQVFTAELQSREERVSTLDAKMKEVERLSAAELKDLQRELEDQVVQREKLQQAAVEMTRLLQEKQNQCVRLQSQWKSSKEELKALDERLQTLTKEVSKREATAAERIESLQAQLEEERKQQQACRETSEVTNEELIKKQEEFVQLTTRMDLFLKELQFRDTQVASLETKLTAMEDLATSEIKALRAQLEEATERRDTWTKTTDDLTQLMKDKKAQVVGLTTRAELFEREVLNRQERVEALEAKIKERQDAEAVKMEPYRKELQRLEEERASWKEKTDEIGRLLKEKIAQSEGLTTRLKLFRVELEKKEERLSLLKATYEDKKQSAQSDVAPVREKLEQQRGQRDAWTTKTEDIDRTLNEKRAQCAGMKTRALLFGRELESKEAVVAELEAVVADKEEAGDSVIARLKDWLKGLVKGRDEWKASTDKVIQSLAERKSEAAGLTAELKGFVGDLQSYQQRRAKLEAEAAQQRKVFGGRREALEEELEVAEGHRDTWGEKIKETTQALKTTEQSIVGLETRAMLFGKELQQRGEVVSDLQKEYWAKEKKSSMKMEQLRGAIKAEQNMHEHGVEKTVKLNKELKDIKRECVGLTTRSELFTRELQKRKDAVKEQERKIHDAETETAAVLARLRNALENEVRGCQDCKDKTEEADRLQVENDEAIVGLGTRLEVFMVQVMEEEDNFALAQQKLKSQKSLSAADPALKREFDAAKEKRDEWTAKALDIENELKTRKSQIDGLKTRKMLFRVEWEEKEDQVRELRSKLAEREKITAENIAPLKEALQGLQQQEDIWTTNLESVNKMLDAKSRQCLPVSKRLEEVIDELTQCTERTEALELQLADEVSFYETKIKSLKANLEQQKKELDGWKKNNADVKQLLQEKKQDAEGLKTRLQVFGGELQKRQDGMNELQSKIEENDKSLVEELDLIDAQIEAEHLERDRIIETTLAKNQALKAIEDNCAAMTVRRKLFEDELRTREEQTTVLEAQLKDMEYDHNAEMKRLKSQLSAKRSDRDKWRDSTQSIEALLKETERECVGLATRSQLFTVEKEKYEQQVADLEDTVTRKETDSAEKIGPIHSQLQKEQEDRDSWDKKTEELDGMLQEHRREVVGLNTRSKLFLVELNKKEQGVAALSAKIKEEEEDFADRMKPLVQERNTVKADREKWEESTANVKEMLERTKSEVASIPTRLDLFRREQETRSGAVAEIEASIRNKEDLVAVQLGFLLNELQLQQKQRGKWKKVTLEMHRLLTETKEQVAALTTKLESCNNEIQQHQEQIMSLEAMLRDTRDMTDQQLYTLRSEVERQTKLRDKLRQSTTEMSRLLEETKEQSKDLSAKLAVAEKQVRDCTSTVESLEAKVAEKKSLDASQIDSIKAQLKIHLGQRAEWRENTNQMKKRLKEKQLLCTSLKTKLALLKNLQSGEVRSSLSTDEPDVPVSTAQSGIAAHLEKITQMTSKLSKKTQAEESLATRMDILESELRKQQENEKELSDSTQQLEKGLKEKESKVANLAGQLTSITKQYSIGAPFLDVDRMLAEKEKKQSNLNSKLESLAGALLSL